MPIEDIEDAYDFIARLRNRFVDIHEYWNGNHNEMAMKDAAIVCRERARDAIAYIDNYVGDLNPSDDPGRPVPHHGSGP